MAFTSVVDISAGDIAALSQEVGSVFIEQVLDAFSEGSTNQFLSPDQRAQAKESLEPPKVKRAMYQAYLDCEDGILSALRSNFTGRRLFASVQDIRDLAAQELAGNRGDWGCRWNERCQGFLEHVAGSRFLSDDDRAAAMDLLAHRKFLAALADGCVELLGLPRPSGQACASLDMTGYYAENMGPGADARGTIARSLSRRLVDTHIWPQVTFPLGFDLFEAQKQSRGANPYEYWRPLWYLCDAAASHIVAETKVAAWSPLNIKAEVRRFAEGQIRPLFEKLVALQNSELATYEGMAEPIAKFLGNPDTMAFLDIPPDAAFITPPATVTPPSPEHGDPMEGVVAGPSGTQPGAEAEAEAEAVAAADEDAQEGKSPVADTVPRERPRIRRPRPPALVSHYCLRSRDT